MPDFTLRVTDPQGRRVVPIDKPLFTIGRRTAADLQIFSEDVSREHAEIVRDGDLYVLRDRGSRFGTFVNGEPVTERRLNAGDRIRLGRTNAVELVFQGDGSVRGGLRDSTTDVTDLRQMAAILDGLRALGSGRVLPEVLTLVMDSALDVTKAERGFVMLANASGELEFKVARGRGGTTLPGTSFTTSAKIPQQVYTTGQDFIADDLMDGSLAAVHDGTIAVGIRCVRCVPLRVLPMAQSGSDVSAGRVMGVLYLDGRSATMSSRATRDALQAFATQAALAIESARLYAEEAEKGRIERDLRVAADIQRALLAEPAYKGAFCELSAVSVPCRTVGGDFYDYLTLSSGAFAFALGDVAGKGPPAALQAAAVQTNFAAIAQVEEDPASAMARVNVALLRRAVQARFATMFYGTLSPEGLLRYTNAGQEPPLAVHGAGPLSTLDAGGPVLGILPNAAYDGGSLQLSPGDLIVVCSDGVTEAQDPSGGEFGRERLVETVTGCRGMTPESALDTLLAAVRTFVGGAPQADDITALVVRYIGNPAIA
jgi:serine phosphatase RsbU (regulator of sigma subunit)/pSer/pThr/pTyr-binding forkhead associated (FHA) protein